MYENLKPIYRSKPRMVLGKVYYKSKRILGWYLSDQNFSKQKSEQLLDHVIVNHETPLYRPLKNIDMWLQDNKVVNLGLAVKKMNGIIIKPGETFSYWKTIGEPTRRKGYLKGMMLSYGTIQHGIGGGLCQLSNMIYWMILHSPLTIVERHRHGFDVFPDHKRTQPFGSGATCVYNFKDLQFINNTHETYQLYFEMTNSHLKGYLYSDKMKYLEYEIFEKDHKFTQAPWGGYIRENSLYRKVFTLEGFLLEEVCVSQNKGLMMYSPLLSQAEKIEIEII